MQIHLYTDWQVLDDVRKASEEKEQNGYVHAWTKEKAKKNDIHISVDVDDVIGSYQEGVYLVLAYRHKKP